MHVATEVYREVTDIETVKIPEDFFNKTFIRHLIFGTGETSKRNERVHALHWNHPEYRFNRARFRGDGRIYTSGAMKYLTIVKKHLTMDLERFMTRAVFVLCPGLSRKGIWAVINGITNDSKSEREIEFIGKKPSRRSTNEDSVIRAVIEEHRAVLGLANQTDKISELKKG